MGAVCSCPVPLFPEGGTWRRLPAPDPCALPRAPAQWKGQRKHRVTLEVCNPLQDTQMSLITYILFSNGQMGYGMLIHYHPVKNDAMKETCFLLGRKTDLNVSGAKASPADVGARACDPGMEEETGSERMLLGQSAEEYLDS